MRTTFHFLSRWFMAVFVCIGCSLVFVCSGCSNPPDPPEVKSTTVTSAVIKGVLVEVDDNKYKIPWRYLRFEGGQEAAIKTSYRGEFFVGYYQEITVDRHAEFISNKCETYDKLCKDFEKRDYDHERRLADIDDLSKQVSALKENVAKLQEESNKLQQAALKSEEMIAQAEKTSALASPGDVSKN